MGFGHAGSRYQENKRGRREIHGPLIKTIMTRCIHCTRCVRRRKLPAWRIWVKDENGRSPRWSRLLLHVCNVIDLCPVGTLTSKPYAFVARPWELTKTESIDAMDAVGSNIQIDARGNEVLRVLPQLHEDVNEE